MSKSKLFNEVKLSKNNATNKYEECSRGKKKLNNINEFPRKIIPNSG